MSSPPKPPSAGSVVEAIRVTRGDGDVVVTTMGAAREWMALGPLHPLDLVFVPSAMSHATSVGLGIALAQPERRVIVVNGDGSMLMNLGSLVTIGAAGPPNLVVIVCDNGAYEVTGAQPTPGAAAGRAAGDRADFGGFARAAGFSATFRCERDDAWKATLAAALAAPGPVFVWVDVPADPHVGGPRSPGPAPERGQRLMAALRATASGHP